MISTPEAAQLWEFHTQHFPGKTVPSLASRLEQPATILPLESVPIEEQEESGLGYYSDGTRRTLTDEQIKMFRHSEIQRLLNERRTRKEREERQKRKIDRVQANLATLEKKKRQHNDDPAMGQVDTLSYDDDAPNSVEVPDLVREEARAEFLWPQLRDT